MILGSIESVAEEEKVIWAFKQVTWPINKFQSEEFDWEQN